MIANVTRPGTDFGGLMRYLVEGQPGASNGSDRVAWIATRNLASDRPDVAAKIMTATASLSVRVRRPAYHLIVSFRVDENPTRGAMLDVANETLCAMGLADHQVLIVAHNDTSNPHMHLMVNRVHPVTGVAWQASRDYARLEQCMQQLAKRYGFIAVPGRHTEPQAFSRRAKRLTDGDYQHTRRISGASLAPWSPEQCHQVRVVLEPVLKAARSWQEAEQAARTAGIEMMRKGQGLVLTDSRRSGFAKLSTFAHEFDLNALEKRFGQSWADHKARLEPYSVERSFELSRVTPPPWAGGSEPTQAP